MADTWQPRGRLDCDDDRKMLRKRKQHNWPPPSSIDRQVPLASQFLQRTASDQPSEQCAAEYGDAERESPQGPCRTMPPAIRSPQFHAEFASHLTASYIVLWGSDSSETDRTTII